MTQRNYAGFYTDGSAARQVEAASASPRPVRHKRIRHKPVIIHVDFLALTGSLVAAVLLVLMMMEFVQLIHMSRSATQARSYLEQQEQRYEELSATYHGSYDLEQIRQQALKRGMIPARQAQSVKLP